MTAPDPREALEGLERLLESCREKERAGDLGGAASLLDAAPEALRHFGSWHHARGALAFRLGDLESALAAFERAVVLEPEIPEYRSNLGAALLERGRRAGPQAGATDLGAALGHLERAAAAGPKLPAVHSNLGLALLEKGEPERALGAFDQALARDPADAAALFNRAAALRRLGRNREALESLERLLAVKPGFEPALAARAKLQGK